MKKPEIKNSTKILFVVLLIILAIAVVARIVYSTTASNQPADSTTIKRVVDRGIAFVSYPTSYGGTWNGSIALFPKNYSTLNNQLSTSDNCTSITPGLNVYYSDDYSKLMIVTNRNLYNDSSDFDNAHKIVFYQSDFNDNNGELGLFKTYCGTFSLNLFAELNIKYPNTDAVRTVVGIGSVVNMPEKISDVGLYIYVYAAKDENLILLSQTLKGDLIFTQENLDSCKEGGLVGLDACLSKFYTESESQKSTFETAANGLVNLFAI